MTSGQHISYKISDFLRISKEEFTGRLRNEDNQIRTWDNEYEHLHEGDESDQTRDHQKYDDVYNYLKGIGLKEV